MADRAAGAAAPELVVRGRSIPTSRPLLMGIVNATPDSFSDGGEHPTTEARVALARRLAADGAALVDIGGQSGITGVPEIPVDEEIDRVMPVVAAVRAELPGVVVSVDTYRPAVAEAVLAAGADVINDISGLRHPELADLCAACGAGLVVMHTRAAPKQKILDDDLYGRRGRGGRDGPPAAGPAEGDTGPAEAAAGPAETGPAETGPADVVGDVVSFLEATIGEAVARGVDRRSIIVDPGPDFAKTPFQTVEVLRGIEAVLAFGRPTLLALSRKDFIGAITGRPPRERLAGTLAAVGHLAWVPGAILRVHEVREAADFLAVADVLAGRRPLPRDARLAPALRRQPR
ncbi:MAG: dihydropteroate synthase [Actinobacteria bacterium]|nr:dihydropteroate synthase [Actinomycetota bacterium]